MIPRATRSAPNSGRGGWARARSSRTLASCSGPASPCSTTKRPSIRSSATPTADAKSMRPARNADLDARLAGRVHDPQQARLTLVRQQLEHLPHRDGVQVAGQRVTQRRESARFRHAGVGRHRQRLAQRRRPRRRRRSDAAPPARPRPAAPPVRTACRCCRPGWAAWRSAPRDRWPGPRVAHQHHGDAGQRRIGGQPAAQLGRVASGHGVVQQDQAGRPTGLAHARQRRFVVPFDDRAVADLGQHRRDDVQDGRAVVDCQEVVARHAVRIVRPFLRPGTRSARSAALSEVGQETA